MKFEYSEEHDELRAVVRSFLAKKAPESSLRKVWDEPVGYDRDTWRQMATQLNLQALSIPKRFGGQGYSTVELNIVLEEMGRALYCGPYFSTVVLAANAFILSGDQGAQAKYLPAIAAGDTIATVAVAEPSGIWSASGVSTIAVKDGKSWRLTGEKSFVVDGCSANVLLIAARTAEGIGLFAVRAEADEITRTPLDVMDASRKLAYLSLEGVEGELIGAQSSGWEILSQVLDLAAIGLAAEQVGGADRCLSMAVAHAIQREQFNRPIGSFQSLKHKCVDVLLGVESAKLAVLYASMCASRNDPELPVFASLVKAHCSDVFVNAAAANIQIHGALGFTWEHSAQLFFKRAKSSSILFGSPAYHRENLVTRATMHKAA